MIISEPHRNAKNRRNRSLHDNDEPHIISRWVQKQQSTTSIYWRIVSSNRLVTCVWSEMKQKREKIGVVDDSRWWWLIVVFSFVRQNLNTKWWTLVKIFHYSLAERANKVSANFCWKNPCSWKLFYGAHRRSVYDRDGSIALDGGFYHAWCTYIASGGVLFKILAHLTMTNIKNPDAYQTFMFIFTFFIAKHSESGGPNF